MQFPQDDQSGLYPYSHPSYPLDPAMDLSGGFVRSSFSSEISEILKGYRTLDIAHLENNLPGLGTEDILAQLENSTWANDPLYGSECDTLKKDGSAPATLQRMATAQFSLNVLKANLMANTGLETAKSINDLTSKLQELENKLYAWVTDGVKEEDSGTPSRMTTSASDIATSTLSIDVRDLKEDYFEEDGSLWKITYNPEWRGTCASCAETKTQVPLHSTI